MTIQNCKFQETLFRKVVIDEYLLLPVKINALFSVTPCILEMFWIWIVKLKVA
jgi:hypothetical protein